MLRRCGKECAGYAVKKYAEGEIAPLPDDIRTFAGEDWGRYDLIFIGAAGIAVRYIAPWVKDKFTDPAVLVMDEKGQYVKTFITLKAGEKTTLDFVREGSYESTADTMAIDMIHREKSPFWVTVDGKLVPHYLHRRKFEEAECGWYYSQSLKSVRIKYKNPKKDYQVVVSFEQFDLIGM